MGEGNQTNAVVKYMCEQFHINFGGGQMGKEYSRLVVKCIFSSCFYVLEGVSGGG